MDEPAPLLFRCAATAVLTEGGSPPSAAVASLPRRRRLADEWTGGGGASGFRRRCWGPSLLFVRIATGVASASVRLRCTAAAKFRDIRHTPYNPPD
ncbi:hypothetical protein ACP4OV_005357 [Aristida adscensionis]